MQSLKSKLIIGMIRNRHLFKFKLKPEVIDENFDVERFRKEVDDASRKTEKIPEAVQVQSTKIPWRFSELQRTLPGTGFSNPKEHSRDFTSQNPWSFEEHSQDFVSQNPSMYAEWLIHKDAPKDKVILYIHGGGFMSGSCLTHRGHVSKFVMGTGIKALLFDYRLAPEHPFPAALDDCVSAYQYLLEEGYAPENILICGESAGGTLTLSTLKALRDNGIPLPKAAVSISPVTDLSCRAESFITNAKHDIAPMNSWSVWTAYYIGNTEYKNAYLSPQFGDLSNLPHIYLCIGTHEIHLDDTIAFAKKAQEQGTQITLKKWENMVHAFPILSPLFREAKEAMDDICRFIQQKLSDKE